jgi:uncharacterized protein (DUF2461 family)
VYVAFSARGLYAGAGIWHLSRDQLVRYREAVAGAPGGELEGIEADLSAGGFELGGETLKRAPKGWAADHPRIGLLRHTSVLVGRSYPPEAWMATPVAKERIIEVWHVARPLTVWLDTHVGPAEEPIRR